MTLDVGQHRKAKDMRESRKKIYSWNGYNPYCYWLSKIIDSQDALKTIINDVNKDANPLENFLKSIPQATYWKEEHIQKANVLFISNEPGLSNIAGLYKNFLNDDQKLHQGLTICDIASAFYESMLSWLALIDHPQTKNINGEGLNEKCLSTQNEKFKKFGKIGYFLKEESEDISTDELKCIYIDLFPFAQKHGTWTHSDPGEVIAKFKKESNPKNSKCDGESIHLCNLRKEEITVKILLNNRNLIKKFLKNDQENKYIFIIGNRSIVSKGFAFYYYINKLSGIDFETDAIVPFSDNGIFFLNKYKDKNKSEPEIQYSLKDNAIYTFKILKLINEYNSNNKDNSNIYCRLLNRWPQNFQCLHLLEPADGIINLPNQRVHLTAIPLRSIAASDPGRYASKP